MTEEDNKAAKEQIDKIAKHMPKIFVAVSILLSIPVVSAGAALATIGGSAITLTLGSAAAAVGLYRLGYNTIHRNKFSNILIKNLEGTPQKENMTKQDIQDKALGIVSTNFFSSIASMKNHIILQGVQHTVVAAAGVALLATITSGFWLGSAALLMATTGTIGTVQSIRKIPQIRKWQKRVADKAAIAAKKTSKPSATPSPSNTLDNVNKPSADFKQVNDNTPKAETKEPANDVTPKTEEPKAKDKNKLSK